LETEGVVPPVRRPAWELGLVRVPAHISVDRMALQGVERELVPPGERTPTEVRQIFEPELGLADRLMAREMTVRDIVELLQKHGRPDRGPEHGRLRRAGARLRGVGLRIAQHLTKVRGGLVESVPLSTCGRIWGDPLDGEQLYHVELLGLESIGAEDVERERIRVGPVRGLRVPLV